MMFICQGWIFKLFVNKEIAKFLNSKFSIILNAIRFSILFSMINYVNLVNNKFPLKIWLLFNVIFYGLDFNTKIKIIFSKESFLELKKFKMTVHLKFPFLLTLLLTFPIKINSKMFINLWKLFIREILTLKLKIPCM